MSNPSETVNFLRARLNEAENREHAKVKMSGVVACPVCQRSTSCTSDSESSDIRFDCGHAVPDHEFIARFGTPDPDEFVLADIASKRRVVDAYLEWSAVPQAQIANYNDGFVAGLLSAVEALASAYSDHPDYRLGWRL